MGKARQQSIAEIEAGLGLGKVETIDTNPYNPSDTVITTERQLKTSEVEKIRTVEEQNALEQADELRRATTMKAARIGIKTGRLLYSIFKGTRNRLEGLSMPGGIWLPLGILLVLFLVLLPVNGHTRLMWLWLAITGNARIGPPLIPPTELVAATSPQSPAGTTVSNPNQGQTAHGQQSTTVASVIQASPKATHQSANKSGKAIHTTQKHVATAKKGVGSGPGPHNPSIPDPSKPISQLSYAHLIADRGGYE